MNYFNPKNYRGGIQQANAFFHWFTKLQIHIPNNKKFTVLDAGCGDGVISEWLLQNHASIHIIGFDASEKQIEGAIQRCNLYSNRSDFRVATFDSISVKEPVDLVIANYSLHLAPRMESAIRNLTQCLKPGGEILTITPVAAPLVSHIYHDGMKDSRFAKYLIAMKDKVHDEHPNGLRFWEEKDPKWMKPSKVRGISQIAISNGLLPLESLTTIRYCGMDESGLRHIMNGINPFTSLIPEELQEEFNEMSFNAFQKGYLPVPQPDGSILFSTTEELVLHARKL